MFDYSFDNQSDINIRLLEIIKNIKRIVSYSYKEQLLLYQQIKPKLDYNANKARELALNINNVPSIIIDQVDNEITINDRQKDYKSLFVVYGIKELQGKDLFNDINNQRM